MKLIETNSRKRRPSPFPSPRRSRSDNELFKANTTRSRQSKTRRRRKTRELIQFVSFPLQLNFVRRTIDISCSKNISLDERKRERDEEGEEEEIFLNLLLPVSADLLLPLLHIISFAQHQQELVFSSLPLPFLSFFFFFLCRLVSLCSSVGIEEDGREVDRKRRAEQRR